MQIMDFVFVIGAVGAFLTTMAFLPQVLKAHQSRQTKDLSLLMVVLLLGGLVCWIFYGISLSSHPVIIANSVTLVLASYLLYLKLKHG